MFLTKEEERILEGEFGRISQKAMEILVALGDIYGADKLIPIKSAQVAGVSYATISDAGLELLEDWAKEARVKVKTTLNPCGVDIEQDLGFPRRFVEKQMEILLAYKRMGIELNCTCTPYYVGNKPNFGDHIAWSESSAVIYANSVLGARTNREGGPSSLAAAIIGETANYGMHLDENRRATILVRVKDKLQDSDYSALGYWLGTLRGIPLIEFGSTPKEANLKAVGAGAATSGSLSLFHVVGVTPESESQSPTEKIEVTRADLEEIYEKFSSQEQEFVCLGCPHTSLEELKEIASRLKGEKVKKDLWVFCARDVKEKAKNLVKEIEDSGAKVVCDTCMVVSPIKTLFKSIVTNSTKACFYCKTQGLKVKLANLDECIRIACGQNED